MKPTTVLIVSVLCLMIGPHAHAQFSSGSDGSYGPLNVTSNTVLDLPPDGKFHCTTIGVGSGATLTFNRNPLNTPVYLLATSNVFIRGSIDVSGQSAGYGVGGKGGPGGFDGGMPANGQGEVPGDGLGPGAGRGGFSGGGGGAYATRPTCALSSLIGQTYGNTLVVPLIGGSGGGGGANVSGFGGGGGGGGALVIASDTRITIDSNGNLSSIRARGATANIGGFGSGGAIRIVAPTVDGNGSLYVSASACNGGDGRIRVDATNRFALFFNYYGPYSIGKYMHVFPNVPSRLDIIEAAGTVIVEGNPGPVTVLLPLGSPTNQAVKVQARDFTGVVPITIAVTPDAGPGTRYDTQIDMAGANVAQTNVSVVIPIGTSCQIHAWTR